MIPMTFAQWEKYGVEGLPPEECNNDPVSVIESVVAYMTDVGFNNATKKKVRLALTKGLKGLRLRLGRPEGSGLEQTEREFQLYRQGYTPKETFLALGIPWTEKEGGRLTARIRSIKRRLPPEDRQAAIDAHWEGRRRRHFARAPRT